MKNREKYNKASREVRLRKEKIDQIKKQKKYDVLREALKFNGRYEAVMIMLLSIMDIIILVSVMLMHKDTDKLTIIHLSAIHIIIAIVGILISISILVRYKNVNKNYRVIENHKNIYSSFLFIMLALSTFISSYSTSLSLYCFTCFGIMMIVYPLFMYINTELYIITGLVSISSYVVLSGVFKPLDIELRYRYYIVLTIIIIFGILFQLLKQQSKLKIVEAYQKQLSDLNQLKETNEMNYRLSRQLEEALKRDPLTGLYNRVYMEKAIESAWDNCLQANKVLTIVMIDVDKFKHINDTYGHLVGDICLKKVSKLIQENVIQNEGLAFRYGGEEFMLLYEGISGDTILEFNKLLEHTISDLVIKELGHQRVTISWGMKSLIPNENTSFVKALNEADKNMYVYKRTKMNVGNTKRY